MSKRTESTNLARNLAWLKAGQENFHQWVCDPSLPAAYACPLCATRSALAMTVRLFNETHLANRALTVEHVPPARFGGRRLVLTCKQCNSTAGHTMEGRAAKADDTRRFLTGEIEGHVTVEVGGQSINARLDARNPREINLHALPDPSPRLSAFITQLEKTLRAGENITLRFRRHNPDDPVAKVTWLKAAYLAMFALLGFRYVFHPHLDVVRRQIQEPEAKHIPIFMTTVSGGKPVSKTDPMAFEFSESHLPKCWSVLFGERLVFLPMGDPSELYGALERMQGAGTETTSFQYTARDVLVPVAPMFGLARRLWGTAED